MIIGVYFDLDGAYAYPLDTERYLQAYYELSEELKLRDSQMVIVRSPETYQGKGVFLKHWVFLGKGEIEELGAITVDKVYDKGSEGTFTYTDVLALNPKPINDLCVDKNQTAKLFSDISPKTELVDNQKHYKEAISKYGDSDLVVIKPNEGFEGVGVKIITTTDANKTLPTEEDYPVLVQQFVDTSDGIPGVMRGVHDLRLFVMNGEVVLSFIRTPADGSLLSNVAQGGRVAMIDETKLPDSALELALKVDKEFIEYPQRLYSVDIAFGKNGQPFLIELNSRPGLSEKARGPKAVKFMHQLADLLVA